MLTTDAGYLNAYKAPARQIYGKVSYQIDNTVFDIKPDGGLVSFSIEKTPVSGKLFGTAITQKITVECLGILSDIQKGTKLVPFLSNDATGVQVDLPNFYVSNIEFNKTKQTTKIVGYDFIGTATKPIKDITFTYPSNLTTYTTELATGYGCQVIFEGLNFTVESAPNFNGYETLQTVCAHVAEMSGTICYVVNKDTIKFRRVSKTTADTLTADHYFDFSSGDQVTLAGIGYGTDLGGENTFYGDEEGHGQVLWDNAFMALKSDVPKTIQTLGDRVIGLSSYAYNLTWRGCPAYEIGDYIRVVEKDGSSKYIFYLGETLTYNGGLRAVSDWEAAEGERISSNAPSKISTLIAQTYAKVDKVNQEIELLASKVEETDIGNLAEDVASLKITTDSITQEVQHLDDSFEGLSQSVSQTLSSENLSILVKNQMLVEGGANRVVTTTGFTFDHNGLTVAQTGAPTKTNVNVNGMIIYGSHGDELLTVKDKGVTAKNLTATNYIIIKDYSRFQAFQEANGRPRVGCFWM